MGQKYLKLLEIFYFSYLRKFNLLTRNTGYARDLSKAINERMEINRFVLITCISHGGVFSV